MHRKNEGYTPRAFETALVGEREMPYELERILSVTLGHAVADALGVPVEFMTRSELDRNPVTDMRGWGSHRVPEGCWSDDTSMSLATIDALTRNGLNYKSVMDNFARWLDRGDYTATGEVFDVGATCHAAIRSYTQNREKNPTESGIDGEYSNGNGSLMRIYPFVLYAYTSGVSLERLAQIAAKGSALTHRHTRSVAACVIFSFVLYFLLVERNKHAIWRALTAVKSYVDKSQISDFDRIFGGSIGELRRDEIKSSGHVVDTLEAAMWCFLTTDDYKSCVLKAVNLGEDTDTVAAVAGALAGALYGYNAIPCGWLLTLKKREHIETMCEDALLAWRRF